MFRPHVAIHNLGVRRIGNKTWVEVWATVRFLQCRTIPACVSGYKFYQHFSCDCFNHCLGWSTSFAIFLCQQYFTFNMLVPILVGSAASLTSKPLWTVSPDSDESIWTNIGLSKPLPDLASIMVDVGWWWRGTGNCLFSLLLSLLFMLCFMFWCWQQLSLTIDCGY